jgi:hypothetical protein
VSARPRRTAPDRSGEPVRITAVAVPLTDDVAARTRRYLIQMSIRVACFLGAVVVDHWTRWLLLVGAVVLPYVAVILANAGRERVSDPGTFLERPALSRGPESPQEPRSWT